MHFFTKLFLVTLLIVTSSNIKAQQKGIVIEGVLKDNYEMTIPYVAVAIPKMNIGTTSTEEGTFYLLLQDRNLQDTLVVSSMGFKTYRIKIEDYLHQKDKTIVLEDDVNELETVVIKSMKEYVPELLKVLKETFLSDTHQLNLVYRRSDVQQGVSKFFVEHHMSMIMKGPRSNIKSFEVNQVRKSADYRISKRKQWNHAAVYMMDLNPMKDHYTPMKKMKWNKIGTSTYDGEDVVILEGTKENVDGLDGTVTTTIYVGYDTNNVYRIESSVGKCVYQYAKNADGKMYLSYHKREYQGHEKISKLHQEGLGLKTPQISTSYKHEAFVLSVITDKKKFTAKGYEEWDKDMADIKLPYNPTFWDNLSLPPETAFYKKIKEELESNCGVPLETQFKYSN